MSFITWDDAGGKKIVSYPCSPSFSYKNSNIVKEMLCQNPNRLFSFFLETRHSKSAEFSFSPITFIAALEWKDVLPVKKRAFNSAISAY